MATPATPADSRSLALAARRTAVAACSRSGASHIGAALSVIDVLAVLYGGVADVAPDRVDDPARDIVLVSKGHSASGVYSVMAHAGYFPVEWLDAYCADGSHLGIAVGGRREYVPTFVQREVSCDYIATSQITTQTGAIVISGNGISFSGNATLQSSTVGGSVGDLVKGSATWRVA